MPLLDFLLHLMALLSPAVFLAMALALWARLRWGAGVQLLPCWQVAVLNFALGAFVLGLGVVLGGHDGRMGTYALLVLVMGTCQWLLSGATKVRAAPVVKP